MTHKIFRLVISLFLALAVLGSNFGTQPARAAGPWYVAPGGNNSNTCLSPGTACATINGALAKPGFIPGDTIRVAIGTYTGTGDEVVLLDKDATLSGGWNTSFTTQSGMSTIDGQASRRGIAVNDGVTAIIEHFTIQKGSAINGGGISNHGNLTLNISVVSNNTTTNFTYGGGIYNAGILTVNSSTIKDNIGDYQGGGIYNSGTLVLSRSTVSNNSLTYNTGEGGGINNSGTLLLSNSTVSKNTAPGGRGGGISNGGNSIINNSTITENETTEGGGINNIYGLDVTLRNSIVARNTAVTGPDCFDNSDHADSITSAGHNLIGDTANCAYIPNSGDLINVIAKLAPLGNYGGTTFTHALYANSPAINAGNPATPGSGGNACLATDQRGIARPKGSACDIGAYEGFLPIPILLSPTGTISDTTPTYKWIKVPGATKYQSQLWKGTTLVYTKTVASSVCGATTCSSTPTTVLTNGTYKWRARAMTGSVWKTYSAFKSFTLFAPNAGFWKSTTGEEFYVTPDQAKVANFTIYITVSGCGSYKITHTPLASIVKKHFSFTGSFYANGTFSTATKASGDSGLDNYFIAGCGYISGGPFSWSAIWKNGTQPTLMSTDESMEIFVEPVMHVPSNSYTIESVNP